MARMMQTAMASVILAGLALSAHAQSPAPLDPPAQAPPILLANVNYWRTHGEPAAALKELQRILSYTPRNPDVIAAAAEVAFDQNDYAVADQYRAMLAVVAPDDPRNRSLAAERQRTPQENAGIDDARQLARDGKVAPALARFDAVFHGTVPPGLAVEYYAVLAASSPEGADEAQQKLGALAEQQPNNLLLQLGYARILALQEDTRNEAIRMLAELSEKPDMAQAAQESWHQVLLWLGPSEKARGQIMAYLTLYPQDRPLRAKLKSFDAVLPSPSELAVMHAFYDIEKDPAKAEQGFRDALRTDPNNTDALVMLAARLRMTNHPAEAELYLDRALTIAPQKRAQLLAAAGGERNGPLPITAGDKRQVLLLTMFGRYDQAQTLLLRMYRGREQPSTYVQLGDIQLAAGQLDVAARSYQRARTMNPGDGDATYGLATTLGREGRYDEAQTNLNLAARLYARTKNTTGQRKIAMGRAGLLRAKATGLSDDAAIALYQDGLAANPRNIYIRADLAHALRDAGQTQQAADVIAKGIALSPGDRQTLQAMANAVRVGPDPDRVQAEINAAKRASLRNLYQTANGVSDLSKPSKASP